MKSIAITLFASLFFVNIYSQSTTSDFPKLTGPYFGQTPPGLTPQIFAPGIITTNLHDDGSPIFSPDGKEVFFRIITGQSPNYVSCLFVMKQNAGIWSKPELSIFTENFKISNGSLSMDGNKFYFKLNKALNKDLTPEISNFWYVQKNNKKWGEAISIGKIVDTPGKEMFVAVAPDHTLYFQVKNNLDDPNDIYYSKCVNGEYTKPHVLGPPIKTDGWEQAPSIAPDGSYMVFTGRFRNPEDGNRQHLYVSFHLIDDTWSEPQKLILDYPNYHPGGRFSTITPDGKYLFFTKMAIKSNTDEIKLFARKWDHEILQGQPRYPYNDADVFWISTEIIKNLKQKK